MDTNIVLAAIVELMRRGYALSTINESSEFLSLWAHTLTQEEIELFLVVANYEQEVM